MAVGDPTGADLASGTTDGDTLPVYGFWEEREVSFGAGIVLTSGIKYAIIVRAATSDLQWSKRIDNPTANGDLYESSDSGSSWTVETDDDCWFKTKAGAVEKDDGSFAQDGFNRAESASDWNAQTFTASSTYTITSVVLKLSYFPGSPPGTVTVSIRATEVAPPGKATTPTPTDDQENLLITGKDRLKQLLWVAPSGETPDYLIYFRAAGDSWVLQETITDDSTSHTLSQSILDILSYYSIYEWRVDTRNDGGTTTGDTWTFISQWSSLFTRYNRRSDYDANKVWNPTTSAWVDINTLEYTGGGSFKTRVLAIGHEVIYFGDI